jgi:hypothetical protein
MPLLFTSQQQQQQQQQQRSSQNPSNKFTINSNSSPTRSIKAPSSTRKSCITKQLKNNNNGDDYSPVIMKFNPASTSLQQNSSTSNHHNHLFKHINTNQSSYRPNLNSTATTNQQPRVTFVLPSSNNSNHNNFSKSVNIASSSTSISQPLPPYVKTKRSGSITTLLPLKVT